jgi:hypothetical protein
MARYTPEFVAGVRHDYENTDNSLARIAVDRGISERTINRWRDRDGWARRSERVRDVPPAMRALQEATALLSAPPPAAAAAAAAAKGYSSARPREGGELGAAGGESILGAPGSPPSRGRAELETVRFQPTEICSGAGTGEADAAPASAASSAIARIERLVEKELAAEEAVRAQLGPLSRAPADAERSARTLATLTQTLQVLARLRCGLPPDGGADDDDDMPRDIDEFRRDLARRIDAFVASRTEPRHAHGDSGPAPVDEGQ